MSQTATQRTTGSTRFRGPTIITLRGAGSKGKDYTLGGVAPVGTGLDVGLAVQIPSAQTANAFQVEQPDGTVVAAIDAGAGLCLQPNVSQRVVRVAIANAAIKTLHTVPVALVAAPAAGYAVMVDHCLVQFTYGSVQMTAGGVVSPVYHGATAQLTTGGLPAASILAAANSYTDLGSQSQANGQALSTATGIDLYSTIQDFASGVGCSIVVDLFYWLIQLG